MALINLLEIETNKVSTDINDYSLLITAPTGFGKAQPLDALVLAEKGYVEMGSLKVGDKVFGEDGNLHNVTNIYPQGKKDIYEIIFSDGTSTECCKEHVWTVQTPDDKTVGKYRNMTLKELMDKKLFKMSSGYKRWNYYIPIVDPIKFEEQPIKLNPYLLGLLIGDGYLASGNIEFSNTEEDIIGFVKQETKTSYKNDTTIRILDKDGSIKSYLSNLGIREKSEAKFIPDVYKFNSEDIRLEVLRGLIDTDGYVNNSSIEFSTSSRQLASDVKFIAESLGCTAVINVKEKPYYTKASGEKVYCKDSYRISLKQPIGLNIFKSEKHTSRFKQGQTKSRRYIKDIRKVGIKEAQCIRVDNPTNLYITNNFIVTHNSPILAELYGDRALFLAFENSHKGMAGINAVQIDSYETLMFYVAQLENPAVKEKFDVLVIDTLYLFEACIEKSITDAYGKDILSDCLKYNKAYKILDKKFLSVLKRIQRLNYTMAYVCHPTEKKIKLQDGTESIKIEPKVSERIKDNLIPEIDIRLFCHFDANGQKVIYTQASQHFDARCRVGEMDAVVPFSATALREAFSIGIERKIGGEYLTDKLEQKNVVMGQARSIEEVMMEISTVGNELAAEGLGAEANSIVNSELGTDDNGNQRGLGEVNDKMIPALEAILVKLKALKK